jgi:hypothetical protein
VNDERSRPDACSHQTGHFGVVQQDRTRGAAVGRGRGALREERPIAHADAGEVELGAEVKRKTGAARVVTPRGVHDERFGLAGQRSDRRLEKRALP